jgi:catechol 2,3-dioxygenase-like lactoylglutathione lyase family enzyme
MTKSSDPSVTATPPDSPVSVQGTDHVTVEGTNPEDTITFYRDILGMPLILSQPNLDRTELTHLYFETGDGRLLTVFVNEERDSTNLLDPDPGQVHHLAFRIDSKRIGDIQSGLEEAGYPVSEYDRGAFHSLYTSDNNGLTIELVADKFVIPEESRAEVLALAHQLRIEDGAEFARTEHLRTALDELGLEVKENDIRKAPSGRDF